MVSRKQGKNQNLVIIQEKCKSKSISVKNVIKKSNDDQWFYLINLLAFTFEGIKKEKNYKKNEKEGNTERERGSAKHFIDKKIKFRH